jgi:glycosyltransferase involved in cell wall biosynthesis
MKIFILTGNPYPNGKAATNRIKCYARALVEGGFDCEVVVYRRTEVFGKDVINASSRGYYEGVPYRYASNKTTRNRNRIVRYLIDKYDLYKTGRYLHRKMKGGDVLLLYMGGPLSYVMHFMKIAHSCGAYCIRDLSELPYGTTKETKRTIKLRKVLVKRQFPRLNGVICISDALMNFAKDYTKSSCKCIKVPIMVEFDHYDIPDYSSKEAVPFIFHAGTLDQQKDGILGMIEAFGMALNKLEMPIKYILTGDIDSSAESKEIRQLIEVYHLENRISFVGYLTREQIKRYLSKASLAISNHPKSKQDYYGFSTKLGEYMASATPIIVTNYGEVMNWIKDEESAYVIDPENVDELSNAIVRVFNKPDEAKRVGQGGKKVCFECFDYRNWIKPLSDFLNDLGK